VTTTTVEYEAKILEIDPEAVARLIEQAGGVHVADRTMRRYVYDLKQGDASRWIRLRDTGSEVTLCVKEIVSDAVDGVRETEVTVGDFDTAHALVGILGYRAKAYQENRRSSWLLAGVRLEIDSWPLIPPYLEIEGDSTEEVYEALRRIGLSFDSLTSENTTAVYARYGIDLKAVTELKFPN
jgi:adenylate cyclase class 2